MLGSLDLERRAAALREQLDRAVEPWRPEKPELAHPEEIVGVLVRIEPFHGAAGYGDSRRAVIRGAEEYDWAVLLKTVLASQFEKLGADVGDLIAIRYLGLRTPKTGGQPYHDFRIAVDRAQEPGPPAFAGVTAQPAVPPATCEHCGFTDGQHSAGCPDELLF